MKKIIFILFIFCFTAIIAQPPKRFYTKFGGDGIDIGYGVKQTLDNNYIIVGSTTSFGVGSSDVYLLKVDSMGQLMWQKTFGGVFADVGKNVIQLPDSGYVLTGFSSSFGNGGYDALTIRTDKKGDIIWQRSFGGLDWDFANDLVYTSDGNIVICGNTYSFGNGKKDGFAVKYNLNGNIIWQKYFGGAEDDDLRSIIKTNDNFIAVVGQTKSKGDINGDCYFAKLDLNGDTLFTRTFGGNKEDLANDITQKVNNEYVIAGAKTYTDNPLRKSYVYSINQIGNFLWDNNFKDSPDINEDFFSVTQSIHIPNYVGLLKSRIKAGFSIQGQTFVAKPGGWGYIINEHGGVNDELCHSIEHTKDGGYIIVGETDSFNSISGDLYFIKLDSTIINYQSIVGIKENKKFINNEEYVIVNNDLNFEIIFNQNGIIENYDFYNASSLSIKNIIDIYKSSNKIVVSKSKLVNGIYFLSVELKNKIISIKLPMHD